MVNDPDSVLSSLTREVKEIGPDGEEVKKQARGVLGLGFPWLEMYGFVWCDLN